MPDSRASKPLGTAHPEHGQHEHGRHEHTGPVGSADEWATRFALLSDVTRLRLVIEMHAEPDLTVAELARRAGITENAASQSLRALRDQGWVTAEKSGRTVHYQVVPDAIVHRILHDVIGVTHHH